MVGQTLWNFIFEGPSDGGRPGLKGRKFRDIGAWTTVRVEHGIINQHSENKGRIYEIHALNDRAPWDPNNHKPTLMIGYEGGETVYTYLHERFNDELVE